VVDAGKCSKPVSEKRSGRQKKRRMVRAGCDEPEVERGKEVVLPGPMKGERSGRRRGEHGMFCCVCIEDGLFLS